MLRREYRIPIRTSTTGLFRSPLISHAALARLHLEVIVPLGVPPLDELPQAGCRIQ
jgi:hypothetical protein